MRISISGEKSLIKALQEEIEQDPNGKVERVEDVIGQDELAFGIGEFLILVTIVKEIAEVVKLLMELKPKVGSGVQKLRLKTALGVIEIEISKDITPEKLYQKLGSIFNQS